MREVYLLLLFVVGAAALIGIVIWVALVGMIILRGAVCRIIRVTLIGMVIHL